MTPTTRYEKPERTCGQGVCVVATVRWALVYNLVSGSDELVCDLFPYFVGSCLRHGVCGTAVNH
jgi:hypothetical protein